MVQINPESLDRVREVLKMNPRGLNIQAIAAKCSINRMSVAKYLEVLTANGIVEVETVGNARVYFLSRRIPVTTYMEYTSKHYCITDDKLNVVQLNEWIPETVGMQYEEFIGRSLPDVLSGVVVNLDDCRAAMAKALAGEATTILVEENFKGKHMFFEMLHMPVQFPDGSHGMMAVSQDITDKKKLEIALREEGDRLRDLVEHIPDIVFATDPTGVLSYISPRIAGYHFDPDGCAGRPFGDLAVPGDRKAVMAGLLAACNEPAPGCFCFRAAVPDGREVWFEAAVAARRDDSAACTAIHGSLRVVPGGEGTGRKKTAKRV
jgi:PAS domain S-box-containing protein